MSSDNPPLFIVFNIGAGDGDAAETRGAIESACAAAGRELNMMVLEDPSRIAELAQEAVRRAKEVTCLRRRTFRSASSD